MTVAAGVLSTSGTRSTGSAAPRKVGSPDAGAAIVEFCFLAVLLMVPLVYVLLTAFRVQGAAYGITAATREAGRAFVTSPSNAAAAARAEAAAAVALADHGLILRPGDLSLSCTASPCLTPGAHVEVRIDTEVALPFLPRILDGRAPASIALHAAHIETVDVFRMVPP